MATTRLLTDPKGSGAVIHASPRGSFAFPRGNACRFPGCGRVFQNGLARRRHERAAHDPIGWRGLGEGEIRRLTHQRPLELAGRKP